MFAKLDPCLLLGASHLEVAQNLGIAGSDLKPDASFSKIGLGIRSLASRMSSKAASVYVQEDLVPVLIESKDGAETQNKIKSLGGTSSALTA